MKTILTWLAVASILVTKLVVHHQRSMAQEPQILPYFQTVAQTLQIDTTIEDARRVKEERLRFGVDKVAGLTLGDGLDFDTNTATLTAVAPELKEGSLLIWRDNTLEHLTARPIIDLDETVTLRDVPSLRTNSTKGATASKDELGIDFVGDWLLGGMRLTIGTTTSTLRTNVLYWDNGLMECPTCASRAAIAKARGGFYPYLDYHDTTYPGHDSRPFKSADERRWITNVVRIHTLTFPWRGQTNIVTSEEIVSSATNYQYLKTEWSAQPPESEVWKYSTTINVIDTSRILSIKP